MSSEVAMEYLQLWCEDCLKFKTQDALGVSKSRWRPLLVNIEALQRFLSSLFGLELVNHLTRQKVSPFVTPAKGLHTNTTAKNKFDNYMFHIYLTL